MQVYHIAGNFQERKQFLQKKLSQIAPFLLPTDAMPPNFVEKTFATSHKTKFMKGFSPKSFLLYSLSLVHRSSEAIPNMECKLKIYLEKTP